MSAAGPTTSELLVGSTRLDVIAEGARYAVYHRPATDADPAAPPAVLLHGVPETSACWRALMPALALDLSVKPRRSNLIDFHVENLFNRFFHLMLRGIDPDLKSHYLLFTPFPLRSALLRDVREANNVINAHRCNTS